MVAVMVGDKSMAGNEPVEDPEGFPRFPWKPPLNL